MVVPGVARRAAKVGLHAAARGGKYFPPVYDRTPAHCVLRGARAIALKMRL